jgi:hypothetical protein
MPAVLMRYPGGIRTESTHGHILYNNFTASQPRRDIDAPNPR